jgi:hypothetical protein
MSFMRRSACSRILLAIIIGAIATSPLAAATLEQPKGIVVVARSMPNALLIWDASSAVGDLVVARQTGDAGMHALEADAIAILASHASTSRAKHLEVRVQYAATGIVGAAYNATTFANATPLVIVGADREPLLARAEAWQRMLASGTVPGAVSVRVVGVFPTPQ